MFLDTLSLLVNCANNEEKATKSTDLCYTRTFKITSIFIKVRRIFLVTYLLNTSSFIKKTFYGVKYRN